AGKLDMGTGSRTISLQDTIGLVDLSVPGVISGGFATLSPAANITGAPRLDLTGVNTFGGAISIQGAVFMRASGSSQALGTTANGISFGKNAVQVISRNNITGDNLITFGFNSTNADTELDFQPSTTVADMLTY